MKGRVVAGVILAILVAAAAGLLLIVRRGEGGVEFVYTLSPPLAAEETASILEHRAGILAPGRVTARAFPDGRVCLRVGGLQPEMVGPLREALERKGHAEVLAAAEREVQEKHNADGRVPPGYRAVQTTVRVPSADYGAWSTGAILLSEPPVLANGDVNFVTHVSGPPNVRIGLQLNDRGIESFNRVAAKLLDRTPRGLVVAALDGRVLSITRIDAPEFTGVFDLNGGDDQAAARAWAAWVLGREHRCLLRPPEVSTFRGKP